jgi:hypothetical protein
MPAYRRIKKPSTDPEEYPNIDRQREAKAESNVQQLCGIGTSLDWRAYSAVGNGDFGSCEAGGVERRWHVVSHLGAGERKEEEEDGPDELRRHCHEMIPDIIRELSRHWHTICTVGALEGAPASDKGDIEAPALFWFVDIHDGCLLWAWIQIYKYGTVKK